MRAVRNTEAGIRVVDVPFPEGPGTRVHVRAAGICGSDLEMVRTGLAASTLGHEIAGVLDDGTEVAIHPFVPCGSCEHCKAGRLELCRDATATMLGVFTDGGMAEQVVVPESCIVPLPKGVGAADASLVEPLAVSLHACNRAGVVAGMRVGVIGAGTIGLSSGAVARHLGAEVTIVCRHDAQRRAAEMLGLAHGAPRDCDIVFEAAGTSSGFDNAVHACRRGGRIGLVSTTWEPIPISFLNAQMREVSIVPAFVYGEAHGQREFDTAVTIADAHPEIAAALVTHRFALEDAAHAFAVAGDRAHGAIKVVLQP
ncbi:MAG TPA: alcohol dehydrogenase catalytic domain-containing protein [Acidimicrobiia bacterium]|nr:alcohol dehydrogenase catalytic domain-containing protein [Acidimicrobiia bacterium]